MCLSRDCVPGDAPGGGISLRALAGVDGPGDNGSDDQHGGGGKGRRQQARSKDDDVVLPLEVDTTAPPMADRKLSSPTLDDIQYILNRWVGGQGAVLVAALALWPWVCGRDLWLRDR